MRRLKGKLFVSLLCVFLLSCAGMSEAGNFTELQQLVNDAANGSLVLAEDYAYDVSADAAITEGIAITGPISIDGGGHTLDGAGAVRIFNITAGKGAPVAISNMTITKGGSEASGGGAFISQESEVSFSGVVITKCGTEKGVHTKDGGAALFIDSKARVEFTDCEISDNIGKDRAGGIYLKGNAVFRNTDIINNQGGSRGGGLYIDPGYEAPERGGEWGGNVKMYDCTVSGNKGGRGGGIYINSENDELNYFENCVISSNDVSENSIGNGGGILFYNALGKLVNCTISGNKAKNGGGVILDVESEIELVGCKILDNQATVGGAGLYAHDGSHADQAMLPVGTAVFESCTMTGNTLLTEEGGVQDVCVHYSDNSDKNIDDPTLGWEPRFDGNFESHGNNVIGVVDMRTPEGVTATAPITLLPTDKVEKIEGAASGSGSSGGCSTGVFTPVLLAAAGLLLIRRRNG